MKRLADPFVFFPYRGIRLVLPIFVGLLPICLGCATAPPAGLAPQPQPPALPALPPGPVVLEAGKPVEGELATGGRAEYLVRAAAGDYLRLRIDQTGIDLTAALLGPDEQPLLTADGPGGRRVPEVLPLLSPVDGGLRLVLTAQAIDAPQGRYKVLLEEIRPGRLEDPERVAAELASAEASHWQASEDAERTSKALAGFEQALTHWRAAGDPTREVDTLNEIGALRRTTEGSQAALPVWEEALAKAVASGFLRGEAQARNNLGLAQAELGKRAEAVRFYQEAIRLWQQLADTEEEALTWYNLGLFHREAADPDQALNTFGRALDLNRAAGDRAGQALVLVALGGVRRDLGEFPAALDLLRQGLELARAVGDPLSEASALQMTATIQLRAGELQNALDLFNEALALRRRIGDRFQEMWVLSNLGAAHLYLGEVDEALESYNAALAISREIGNPQAESFHLRDIGWVEQLRQEPERALEHYSRAYQICRGLEVCPAEAPILLAMGRSLLSLGRTDEAIRQLEQAEPLFARAKNALNQIQVLTELGRAWRTRGDLDRAADTLDRALTLSRQRQTLVAEAVALAALARLEAQRGDLRQAVRSIEESLRIVESVRSRVTSQRLRVSFLASRREDYELYIDLLMRLHEEDPGGGHLDAALAASERARARGLLDLLAEGRIDVRQGISSELKQLETEIADRISWLQSQLLDDLSGRLSGPSRVAELEAELARATEERERLEVEIRREHPRYAAVRDPHPLPTAEIPALLDERTALLEYSVGQDASFLFVVTHDRRAAWRLPPAAELEALVDDLRQGVEQPGRTSYNRFTGAARELHEILLAPAAELLRGKSHLIVSPDGPLLLLPFEALLTAPAPARQEEGRLWGSLPYLLLDRSITYVPSASVLAELRETRAAAAPSAGKRFVGFGDPAYGVAQEVVPAAPAGPVTRALSYAGLPQPSRLVASRRELQDIAGLYRPDEVTLFLDGSASEENVKGSPDLSSAHRVHFAVHGFLNEQQPELSGLVLALDGDPRQDGLLQVFEVFNLELHADLVVLSACSTALGRNVRGEGLLGITRAFLYAGTASVAVSLWQVADDSTADLMTLFYRHLDASGDAAEALRRSKLELMQGPYGHPYHWAPFILIGLPGEDR